MYANGTCQQTFPHSSLLIYTVPKLTTNSNLSIQCSYYYSAKLFQTLKTHVRNVSNIPVPGLLDPSAVACNNYTNIVTRRKQHIVDGHSINW